MIQKRLAANIMGCSPKHIRIRATPEEIKNAIRKADVRALIKQGKIERTPSKSNSRGRIRKRDAQKAKGRQRGHGTRKGTAHARSDTKENWKRMVRLQRKTLRTLRATKIVDSKQYRTLYTKIRGGFFRSKRHLLLYVKEQTS